MRGWQFSDLLLVLVVLAVVSLLTTDPATAATDYEPVGDELFDRTAQWVLKELKQQEAGDLGMALMWLLNPGPHENMYPPAVDLTELLSWESEFGDDPRYWQLRYRCTADIPGEIVNEYEAAGLDPRLYYLEVAREEGHADAATLWVLWGAYRELWIEEYLEGNTDEELKPWELEVHEQELVLMERHGAELTALLDEMVSASPELSWPYYRRARHHYIMGNHAAALADLRRGNTAPDNEMPDVFPLSVVRRAIHHNQPLGNETLNGGLLELGMIDQLPNFQAWKQVVREIAVADHQNQQEWLDETHWFACRFGDMEQAHSIQRIVGYLNVTALAEGCLAEYPQRYSVEQREALLEVLNKAGALKLELQQYRDMADSASDAFETTPLLTLVLSPWVHSCAADFRQVYDYLEWEYFDLDNGISDKYFELAQFDYTTMSWPQEEDDTPVAPSAE